MKIALNKEYVEDLIYRGERIGEEEYHPSKDGFFPDYVDGPKYDIWMNEINIFNERYLKDHPIYRCITNTFQNHKSNCSAFEDMMGYLRALAEDDEFFERAEQRKDTTSMGFNKLPSNSEQLLRELLESSNPTEYLAGRFKNALDNEDGELRGIIRELKSEGYIDVIWADNLPYHVTLNNSARTYHERLAEYEKTNAPIGNVTAAPQTVNNYFGNTNVINAPTDGTVIVAGNNNTISFSYTKASDIVSEIASELEAEDIPSEEIDTAMELLNEINDKISAQKKPSIIKSALVGLKDFLIGVGASATVAIIQAKMQGLF